MKIIEKGDSVAATWLRAMLLALPLLAGAAATLAEMATFESAGVTDREH